MVLIKLTQVPLHKWSLPKWRPFMCVVSEWQDVLRYNISCVVKILISIKLILINFANGFVHQKLNQFYWCPSWGNASNTFYRWLLGGPSILDSIHDFANKHSRFWSAISGYFLQIWTLSASRRNWQKLVNHLDWKVCWYFFLIFCVFFRSSFAFINLLGWVFVARALQSFLLLLNICPLSRPKPDLYVQGW